MAVEQNIAVLIILLLINILNATGNWASILSNAYMAQGIKTDR